MWYFKTMKELGEIAKPVVTASVTNGSLIYQVSFPGYPNLIGKGATLEAALNAAQSAIQSQYIVERDDDIDTGDEARRISVMNGARFIHALQFQNLILLGRTTF
jgi:predicted RNase H-like HicB family nuclease